MLARNEMEKKVISQMHAEAQKAAHSNSILFLAQIIIPLLKLYNVFIE